MHQLKLVGAVDATRHLPFSLRTRDTHHQTAYIRAIARRLRKKIQGKTLIEPLRKKH
jgi:hypothetical protein